MPLAYVTSLPMRWRNLRRICFGDGVFWLAAQGSDLVVELDASDATLRRAFAVRQPRGICRVGERLFVASFAHGVVCIDLPTGLTRFRVPCTRPRGITSDGHRLYVTSVADDCIVVFTLQGAEVTRLRGARLSEPRGIDIDAQGRLVVADSNGGRVVWLTPQGRVVRSVSGVCRPNDVVCRGNDVFVSEWSHGCVRWCRAHWRRFGARHLPPDGGALAMMGWDPVSGNVYVSDDDRDCLHVFATVRSTCVHYSAVRAGVWYGIAALTTGALIKW